MPTAPLPATARLAALALAVAPILAMPARAAAQERTERVALGGDVVLWNLAGHVRVEAGSGSEVAVEVTRGGRDGERLRLVRGSEGGREALRVVFPQGRIVYPGIGRGSTVRERVDAEGRFGGGGSGVRGWLRGGDVEIRGDGDGTEAWADLVVRVPAGRRVVVHLAAGSAEARDVDADLTLDVHSARVDAERTRGRLAVDAGSGAVSVRDAQGEVLLDTGSGSVELSRVRARRLAVDVGSGGVRGGDLVADEAVIDLGSGSARLQEVRVPRLRVDAGSGSVDVDLAADVDDVRIDTGSGSVTLRLASEVGASLDVDTGSGGIRTDVPLQITRRERDHLTGSVGDGRGRIAIDTGSGGVRVLPR